jgi:hypothetical protein
MRRLRDLALGVRLSVAGGRGGWARLAMISAGVGLGVAMLLLAASVPSVMDTRGERLAARGVDSEQTIAPASDTLLTSVVRSRFGSHAIEGRLLQPEGTDAPLPPGVTEQLAVGDLVVSPALQHLLESDEGELLRERWGERVVGTIGPTGLAGPDELTFYLGVDHLTEESATRIDAFGVSQTGGGDMPPELLLLGVVALVVLLVPVAIFVATAVRFGGEARDRRLAALRLVGADISTTRRIAAGETLVGAALGLVVGGVLFLALAEVVTRAVPPGMSFFRADLQPLPVLAALVAVLVPATAVLVTVSALRRVSVEPLGVVRRSGARRRRLWWRLVLPVAGVALLLPLRSGMADLPEGFEYQVMGGVTALLIGMALLLPWLVEATVRRLGGGSVPWELAVRRLQLDSGTSVRAVSGIAVSVAGVIAVQGLLAAVEAQYAIDFTRSAEDFQVEVYPRADEPADRWRAALEDAPGTEAVGLSTVVWATSPEASETRVVIGDCTVLSQSAGLDGCEDGDVFVLGGDALAPGTTFALGEPAGSASDEAQQWTVPSDVRTATSLQDGAVQSAGGGLRTLLLTPAALGDTEPVGAWHDIYVALDPADPQALDRLRNAAAQVDPAADVVLIRPPNVAEALATVRQMLLVGATALLALIGASMLVNVVEQLRERSRLLAVLVAFGTRRSTLGSSVLLQVALPVLLGLSLAVVTGSGLAAILQLAADAPVRFDWLGIGATTGVAALVVLLTTGASLPLLWRLTRPGGLRSE